MAERRRRLLEQVRDRGYVSFRELAEALETTMDALWHGERGSSV